MVEIEVDRGSGELILDGQIMAKAVDGVAPSALERFFQIVEGSFDPEGWRKEVEDLQDVVEEMEQQLERIKEICDE